MRPLRAMGIALVLLSIAAPARADITAFIGANTTPDNRQVRGGALGFGLLIVGFEGEYAFTPGRSARGGAVAQDRDGQRRCCRRRCRSSASSRISRPAAGSIRRRSGSHSETGFALNTGGGVKVTLAGPIRLRVDYRIFKLGSGALYSPAHRIYAGLNLKF